VLTALFAGVDLIGESEAGGLLRVLAPAHDPEQSATLEQALDQCSHVSLHDVSIHEAAFPAAMTRALLEQGGTVHEVLQSFARSLKHFVQSPRISGNSGGSTRRCVKRRAPHLPEGRCEDHGDAGLHPFSSAVVACASVSQWKLFDPALHTMRAA